MPTPSPKPGGCAAAVPEWSTTPGPADYPLCADGHIMGYAEAKCERTAVHGVLTQVKRLALSLQSRTVD